MSALCQLGTEGGRAALQTRARSAAHLRSALTTRSATSSRVMLPHTLVSAARRVGGWAWAWACEGEARFGRECVVTVYQHRRAQPNAGRQPGQAAQALSRL